MTCTTSAPRTRRGRSPTRFGTKDQLLDLVAAAHRHGLRVMADVVLNHADGADYAEPNPVMERLGWTDIPKGRRVPPEHRSPEAKKGDTLRSWTGFAPKGADGKPGTGRFPRSWRDFHPNEAEPDRDPPYHLKEFGQDYAFRDGHGDYVRHQLIAWAHWFIGQTGIDGYRLDDLKGVEPDMTADFLEQGPAGLWSVGEYFDGDIGKVMDYYHQARGCTNIFDFPLFYALRDMTNHPERFDMRDLLRRRLPERDMAVPFVSSHDVSRNENAIQYNVPLAYAVILAMAGTPCVYLSDLWRAGKAQREQMERLMRARRLAVGEEIARWEDNTVLALERSGSLLAAFHSGGVGEERTITVDTAFGPHVRLRDQAGDGKPLETDAQGRVTLTLEPHSYVYYAPTGRKRARPRPKPLPTRQTWEFADDLDTGRLTREEQHIKTHAGQGPAPDCDTGTGRRWDGQDGAGPARPDAKTRQPLATIGVRAGGRRLHPARLGDRR